MQFDWPTFAFQIVNILVLFWLLGRYLFKPVAAMIAERRNLIDKALEEADAAKKAAGDAAEAARQEKERLAADRFKLLESARTEAEAQGKALLAKAKNEAADMARQAQLKLQQGEEDERKERVKLAAELTVQIARKLLENLPADARFSGYPKRLADALSSLDDDARLALAAEGDAVRLVAARPLNKAETEQARKAVEQLRPTGEPLRVEVDESLIAGLELRSRHGVIHNSLAFDLKRIAEAMKDGKAD